MLRGRRPKTGRSWRRPAFGLPPTRFDSQLPDEEVDKGPDLWRWMAGRGPENPEGGVARFGEGGKHDFKRPRSQRLADGKFGKACYSEPVFNETDSPFQVVADHGHRKSDFSLILAPDQRPAFELAGVSKAVM